MFVNSIALWQRIINIGKNHIINIVLKLKDRMKLYAHWLIITDYYHWLWLIIKQIMNAIVCHLCYLRRHWSAHLAGGTQQPIADSQYQCTGHQLRPHSTPYWACLHKTSNMKTMLARKVASQTKVGNLVQAVLLI